jgi:diguanylate cyclase (GGDEF)-like protein
MIKAEFHATDLFPLRRILARASGVARVDWDFLHEEAGDLPMSPKARALHATTREQHRGRFFMDLMFKLTHAEFAPARAEELWNEIMHHRNELSEALGRNVGVSVAAHDYLSNITQALHRPVIVPDDLLRGAVEAATRDELTGIFARATARARLEDELRRTERYGQPVSVALIDIDHFKRVNDTLGHLEGDRVLTRVARVIEARSRTIDLVARYGGEEFIVIAPGITEGAAYHMAERLRECVRDAAATAYPVTVSVGVVTVLERREVDVIIAAADDALYRAKRAGRDRSFSARVLGASPDRGTRGASSAAQGGNDEHSR